VRLSGISGITGISVKGENDWTETSDWTDRSAKRIDPIATSRE